MIEFTMDKPIYLQIIDMFYTWIVSGVLHPGDQVPPVRKIASDLGLNPNTIQKALQYLDETGVTVGIVGKGRFVTKDEQKLQEVKQQLITKELTEFYNKMCEYGIANSDIVLTVQKFIAKKEGD